MANTIDNKITPFNQASFRGAKNVIVKGTVPVIPELKEKKSDIILSPPLNLDIEELVNSTPLGSIFGRTIQHEDKKKLYSQIDKMIKDDLSFKGGSLTDKKKIKDFMKKECLELSNDFKIKFGIDTKIDDFSLTSLLLSLLCSEVNNAFSSVLNKFSDYVSPDLIRKVIPKVIQYHNGKGAKDIIKDIVEVTSKDEGVNKSINLGKDLVGFYNKEKVTTPDHVPTMLNALDTLNPTWQNGVRGSINLTNFNLQNQTLDSEIETVKDDLRIIPKSSIAKFNIGESTLRGKIIADNKKHLLNRRMPVTETNPINELEISECLALF